MNFIIIGCQKGSTTSLRYHLRKHEQLHVFENELHHFDSNEDIQEYIKLFNGIDKNKIIGEVTPSYCYLRYAIDKIYNYNPNMKLIYILREPIQRMYSQYNMKLKQNQIEGSFKNFYLNTINIELKDIKINDHFPTQRGLYIEHINYILTKFSRNNLLILITEDNDENKYNSIFNFLDIHKSDLNLVKTINSRDYDTSINQEDFNFLYNYYKPYNEKLYIYLGYRIKYWDNFYKNYNIS